MDQRGDWVLGRKLGEGGQGTVHYAYKGKFMEGISGSIFQIASTFNSSQENRPALGESLVKRLRGIVANPEVAIGAIKELRELRSGEDVKKQGERLRKEIEAARRVNHPNFIRLLDRDPEYRWYVMEYHEK